MTTLAIARPRPFGGFLDGLRELGALVLEFAAYLTNTGVALYVDWADGTVASPHTEYLGWGTSATTAAKADTDLGTAGNESRVAASRSQSAADTYQWTGTIASSGGSYPRTYKEVGLFSAAGSGNPPSGGTCILHANHTDGTVNADADNIPYTLTLQLLN